MSRPTSPDSLPIFQQFILLTVDQNASQDALAGGVVARRPNGLRTGVSAFRTSAELAPDSLCRRRADHSRWTKEDHEIFDLVSALEAAEGEPDHLHTIRSPNTRPRAIG